MQGTHSQTKPVKVSNRKGKSASRGSEHSEQRNCSVDQFEFPFSRKVVFHTNQNSQDRVTHSYNHAG